ncbi:MAG: DUF2470 domain-containing protein [Acetobacterales bacterium]
MTEPDEAAREARNLVRGAVKAALATVSPDRAGAPHVALVTVATDIDGRPLLLLSELSRHTRDLCADGRAALLFDGTGDRANPQEGPRVTVQGRAIPTEEPRCRARFLARHPGAALYAGFGDFRIWRVEVEALHLVGGFARARRLGAGALVRSETAVSRLAAAEEDIIAHMNADHGDAMDLIAQVLLRRRGRGWRMTGIDPDGCDLMLEARRARVAFSEAVDGPEAARRVLVALTAAARKARNDLK